MVELNKSIPDEPIEITPKIKSTVVELLSAHDKLLEASKAQDRSSTASLENLHGKVVAELRTLVAAQRGESTEGMNPETTGPHRELTRLEALRLGTVIRGVETELGITEPKGMVALYTPLQIFTEYFKY